MQTTTNASIVAFDIGTRRIGVALAGTIARLPRPLTTLTHNDAIWEEIEKIINTEQTVAIVVGLPQGLAGQDTEQTRYTEKFIDKLRTRFDLPIYIQDEALSSQRAEAELKHSKKIYDKSAIDALAATYILEEFLREHPEVT